MSDFKIIGNSNPIVGKEEFYSVNNFLPNVLPFQSLPNTNNFEHPVKWEIYILENGRWRKTKENDKTGKKVSYTFLQKSLERKGIRILVRRGEETARLDVKTHRAEKPKIESIELLDKSGKKPAKPLSYGQTLKARVHCLHMDKRKIFVTLWEDDAKGAGHNKSNEKNIIQTRSGIVKGGIADVDFVLSPSFAKIATMAGAEEDKIHEYYVTTDFDSEKLASNNVNVNELETPVAPYKKKVPVQQPTTAKPPVQLPKTNIPTPKAPAKAKSEITRVHITDADGRDIKGVYKEKQIKVWIDSVGLKGKEITLKLYDQDPLSNDLLLDQKFTITNDIFPINIFLSRIPRSKGEDLFEGNEQELFADVQVTQTHQSKQSAKVDVDSKVFKQDIVDSKTVTKVGEKDEKDDKKDEKKGVCPNCDKPVTVAQLKKIFTQADDATLKKAADTYTKYMKELSMNTCWNKAHFFAQAVVESGLKLHVRGGESFNWYFQSLIDTFGKFQTQEGKKKAKDWGRKILDRRDPNAVDVTPENEKNIANWAYAPDYKTGKDLGNKGGNDGWDFRGKGLIQLTGRGAYEYANKYTLKAGSDIIKKPDLVVEDVNIAVLSSMAFWKWKNICNVTNGNSSTESISIKVGKKVRNNYSEKQDAFDDYTSKSFKINDCTWGKKVVTDKNKLKTYDNAYTADSKVAYIDIIVPDDRRNEGLLVVFDNKEILFKCYVLAMGTTNNAIMIPEGHGSTPKGLWSSWYEKVHIGESSYGKHGLIKVTGISGDALTATKKGRNGIAIHSGHTHKQGNTINDNSYLEFTYGCMRVYNADMKTLVETYNKLKNSGKKINIYVEEVSNINKVFKEYDFKIDSKDVKRNYSKNAKQ